MNRWRQGIWLSVIGAAVVIFGYWGCFTSSGIRSFEGSKGVFPLLCVLLGPVLTFIGLTFLSLGEIRWEDPFPGEGPDPMFAFALAILLTWFAASLDLCASTRFQSRRDVCPSALDTESDRNLPIPLVRRRCPDHISSRRKFCRPTHGFIPRVDYGGGEPRHCGDCAGRDDDPAESPLPKASAIRGFHG